MKTTLRVVAVILLLLLSRSIFSQQLRLGDNPYSVEKSAVLELSSNNQGLLLPRISDTTSINLLNPPDGMVIYFTPDKRLLLRSNGYWKELTVLGVTSLNGNYGALTMDTGYIANFYSKVRSLFSASAPIILSNGQIGISQSTTSTNGYLSSADWNTFNNKQAAGNYVTDPGGNGIMVRTALNSSINRTLTGTANRISITNGDGTGGNPTIDINSSYAGQTSLTTLGTIGTGTWNGTKISEAYGGTNQTTYTLGDMLYSSASNTLSKLAGNTTVTKKFLSQTGDGTLSAAPSWTTLSNSDVGLGNVENTALSMWTGSTNLTTLGTIGVGTWNGSIISGTYGGTGVNNGTKKITLGNNFTTSGNFALTLTQTGTTNVTLPTSGTLATLDGVETFTGAKTFNAGKLIAGANTTTDPALTFTPTGASLETTAAAGGMEVDANGIAYYTHAASERGVVDAEQFISLSSAYTLTSTTSVQKLFNSTANGRVTVASSKTYYFECLISLSSMSATSGNAAFSLAGTSTFTSLGYTVTGFDGTTLTTVAATSGSYNTTTATAASMVTAGTGTSMWAIIKGTLRVNSGGTIIPSIALVTAAAAVVGTNSYFRIVPVGTNTVTNVGNWN
jgi:hypothetical protein